MIATDISPRKETQERLLTYQERLRSLTSELAVAEQRERRRIASDLHDRIGQSLAISKIKISQLRGRVTDLAAGRILEELRGFIDQTIEDTRSLTFELSPPVLNELGLAPALEWLTERVRQRHGILTTFRDDGLAKPMGDDLRGVVFQAVQELLLNVAKHASARRAGVSLGRRESELRCEVIDDGMGFDTSPLFSGTVRATDPTGFGLFSIRERLHHLGGRLEIDSTVGRGTKVVLWAPLLIEPAVESGEA